MPFHITELTVTTNSAFLLQEQITFALVLDLCVPYFDRVVFQTCDLGPFSLTGNPSPKPLSPTLPARDPGTFSMQTSEELCCWVTSFVTFVSHRLQACQYAS